MNNNTKSRQVDIEIACLPTWLVSERQIIISSVTILLHTWFAAKRRWEMTAANNCPAWGIRKTRPGRSEGLLYCVFNRRQHDHTTVIKIFDVPIDSSLSIRYQLLTWHRCGVRPPRGISCFIYGIVVVHAAYAAVNTFFSFTTLEDCEKSAPDTFAGCDNNIKTQTAGECQTVF